MSGEFEREINVVVSRWFLDSLSGEIEKLKAEIRTLRKTNDELAAVVNKDEDF
jgi:cell division protein FtsB